MQNTFFVARRFRLSRDHLLQNLFDQRRVSAEIGRGTATVESESASSERKSTSSKDSLNTSARRLCSFEHKFESLFDHKTEDQEVCAMLLYFAVLIAVASK